MSIFSDKIQERDNKPNPWLKSEDFEKGVDLLIKSVDIVEANQYGAEEGDSLFDKEILQEGETVEYIFEDLDGNERKYNSKGAGLYFAFKQVNPLPGSVVSISKSGKGDATRWVIKVK